MPSQTEGLTKQQAERQIQELQDHVKALDKDVIVRGGDIVQHPDGQKYIVGKTSDGWIGLISLKNGNWWADPCYGSHYDGVPLRK